MIKVYHAQRARSARVIWLLEELAVPYELELVAFKPEVLRSPAYLALHPLGQVPVVEVDGQRMIESGAIVELLLERYGQGRLAPAYGSDARAPYLTWFHFGEASLAAHVTELVRMRFGTGGLPAEEANLAVFRERLRRATALVETELAGRDFLCGDAFSAADIMVSYGLIMARIVRELPADMPHVAAYLARLKERPSYAKAWA